MSCPMVFGISTASTDGFSVNCNDSFNFPGYRFGPSEKGFMELLGINVLKNPVYRIMGRDASRKF